MESVAVGVVLAVSALAAAGVVSVPVPVPGPVALVTAWAAIYITCGLNFCMLNCRHAFLRSTLTKTHLESRCGVILNYKL